MVAVGVAWRARRAERLLYWLWAGIAASTGLLLLLTAFSLGPAQDVSLTATLLAPANLGLALASRRLWLATRSRSADETRSGARLSQDAFG